MASQEVCVCCPSVSTADFSTWTTNKISSHQDEVSEFVFCIHSCVLSDSFSLINNNKDTESEQAGNFVDETWGRADSSWLFNRYIGQLTGIKLQETWHTKQTRWEETDSRGRQVGRHCTAQHLFAGFESKAVASLLWTGSEYTISCQLILPPFKGFQGSFQRIPRLLAGGRHMQSQAAILGFSAHFVLLLSTWKVEDNPGVRESEYL